MLKGSKTKVRDELYAERKRIHSKAYHEEEKKALAEGKNKDIKLLGGNHKL